MGNWDGYINNTTSSDRVRVRRVDDVCPFKELS